MRFIILIAVIIIIFYFIKSRFKRNDHRPNHNRENDIYTDATINDENDNNINNTK